MKLLKEMNQELSNLSKNLASLTVSSVLNKHKLDKSNLNSVTDEQKQELIQVAKNLETLVNDYVNGEDMKESEEDVTEILSSEESPLRKLLKKKKESEA